MIRLALLCCFLYAVKTTALSQETGQITGRTTDTLPYLKYGLGEDRLGGAKMTYLDTTIAVVVIDSVTDFYKIRLSQSHVAWLPKVNFKQDPKLTVRPYYLTGDCQSFVDDKYDYVTVWLEERLPYRSIQQVNPSKILVDIYGATSNTNWINQLSTAKEIKNVYYEQVEDDVFRLMIELNHPQHWGYKIYYDQNKLVVRVNRQPGDLRLNKLKIAVDAGHGGDNLGTKGITSRIKEKDYTLRFAKYLEEALTDEGAEVFMTRTSDTTLTMPERTLMLREQSPDLLISVHLNSSDKQNVKGASTYYRYIGFRPLTQAILKRLLELGLEEFGNIGGFNFSLSGPTEYPNCLVEVAFLSNREDERRVRDVDFQKQVAGKIVDGIKDWLQSLRE